MPVVRHPVTGIDVSVGIRDVRKGEPMLGDKTDVTRLGADPRDADQLHLVIQFALHRLNRGASMLQVVQPGAQNQSATGLSVRISPKFTGEPSTSVKFPLDSPIGT